MNTKPEFDDSITKMMLEFEFKGKIVKTLEGNSGQVFIVDNGENSYPRCIAYKSLKEPNPEKIEYFKNEIKNWFKSKNSYLVTPFYVHTIMDKEYVCMPAFEGNLIELLQADFDIATSYIYSLQVIKGVMNLNKFGVNHHQDLNPPNILFQDLSRRFRGFPPNEMHSSFKFKLYISDLGIADLYNPETSTNKFGGKFAFKAPEQYEGINVKGFAPDIFALGVLLTLLFSKIHPSGLSLRQINKKSPKNPQGGWVNWATNGERIINISDNLIKNIIFKMLSPKPSERPNIEEIFKVLNNSLLSYDRNIYTHINFYFKYFDSLDSGIDEEQRDASYWKNFKKY